MAEAQTSTEYRKVRCVEEVDVVTLKLDRDEVTALLAVLRHVGGDPDGPRGKTSNIIQALHLAGYQDHAAHEELERAGDPPVGSIRFMTRWEKEGTAS